MKCADFPLSWSSIAEKKTENICEISCRLKGSRFCQRRVAFVNGISAFCFWRSCGRRELKVTANYALTHNNNNHDNSIGNGWLYRLAATSNRETMNNAFLCAPVACAHFSVNGRGRLERCFWLAACFHCVHHAPLLVLCVCVCVFWRVLFIYFMRMSRGDAHVCQTKDNSIGKRRRQPKQWKPFKTIPNFVLARRFYSYIDFFCCVGVADAVFFSSLPQKQKRKKWKLTRQTL